MKQAIEGAINIRIWLTWFGMDKNMAEWISVWVARTFGMNQQV